MVIIGITGRIGSGKSEIAKHLIATHGFERAKFANALKEMLRTLLRYRGVHPLEIERYIEGDLKEVPTPFLNGKSPRHAMITLGTEWGRDLIDPDLWVDTESEHLQRFHASRDRVLFDDVRFENEVAAIRRLGGVIWRVERPGRASLDHESERLNVEADVVIRNDGDLDGLRAFVDWQAMPRFVVGAPQ